MRGVKTGLVVATVMLCLVMASVVFLLLAGCAKAPAPADPFQPNLVSPAKPAPPAKP